MNFTVLFAASTELIFTVACLLTYQAGLAWRPPDGGRGGILLYALDAGSRLLEFGAEGLVVDDIQGIADIYLCEVASFRAHLESDGLPLWDPAP